MVDASVAVQWVVPEAHSRQALAMLDGSKLHAPAHWLAEATNAVWNKARRGEFDLERAAGRVEVLGVAPVNTVALSGLVKQAFRLSMACGSSMYDSFYVAVAVDIGLTLVTADVKLLRKLRDGGLGEERAVWIGAFA